MSPFDQGVMHLADWIGNAVLGIGRLHIAFCEWEIARAGVPCIRDTFERLLEQSGHLIVDGMVSELILREDATWAKMLLPTD